MKYSISIDDLLGKLLGVLIALLFLSGNFSVLGTSVRIPILLFTLMLLLVSIVLGYQLRLPKIPMILYTYWVLLVLLLFSATWSHNLEQASRELSDISTVFVFFILAIVIFNSFPKSIDSSLSLILLVAILYSAVAILTSVQSGGRGTIIIGGPNVATRIVFFGVLSVLYLNLSDRRGWFFLLLPVLLAGLVALGSRGGLVGAAVVLGLFVFIKFFHKPSFLLKINLKSTLLLLVAVGLFVYYLFPLVSNAFESRVVELLINRLHMAGRESLYARAWELIQARPIFGYGLGGYYGNTLSFYPHNIILQLWLDGGIIFVVIFVVLFVTTLRLAFSKNKPVSLMALGLFYMLVVHQVSGGYYDFRYFYYFLAVICVLTSRRCKSNFVSTGNV